MLNFSAYDYLGLNGHPAVSAAAKAAIDQYGTSVSASRIVAGDIVLHRELEAALADYYQTEAALAFVSRYRKEFEDYVKTGGKSQTGRLTP